MKKLFPYLLLNIVVSALTMLAVILIWNASHPTSTGKIDLSNLQLLTPTNESSINLPAIYEKTVSIDSVYLPGELNFEKITLNCIGDTPIDLTNWVLQDGQGHQFSFPAMTLFPEGAIDIFSKSGVNSAVELYWNSAEPIWASGDIATLTDSAGNERATYTIP